MKDQIFGEALSESQDFKKLKSDGTLGLALSNSSGAGAATVFNNLVRQKLVPEPVFSIYLSG